MTSLRTVFVRATVLATLVPLLLLGAYLWYDQERSGRAVLDRQLWFAVTTTRQVLDPLSGEALSAATNRLAAGLGMRVTVIAADGTVLADSEARAREMENHANRPEVRQALASADGIGRSERQSATVHRRMRYTALLAEGPHGGPSRIYRAEISTEPVHQQILRTQLTLLGALMVVLITAVLVATPLARRLVAPVEALSDAAERFTEGNADAHVIPDGHRALVRLGTTFNAMVDRISAQVRSLDEAQGNLEAVISQMPDGLLVVDSRAIITRANRAALTYLQMPRERVLGRSVLSVILHYTLDQELQRVLSESGSAESPASGGAVEMRTPDGTWLQVSISPFRIGGAPGAVLLLQDITELRRADEMRRDFVANVSHELRTPVAAIRALMETVMLRGAKRPELVAEYGPRVVGECERIDRLVQDLLLLAQTEAGQLRLNPEILAPREVAEDVLRQVEPVAATATTELALDDFTPGKVRVDRFALSQSIRNLVDNAVRYAAGGRVRVGSRLEPGTGNMVIYVADNGPGIPAADLPRIFERFYRVDKARSRDESGGGSGLGLSIVRHLTEAQGGRAWAESPTTRPTDGTAPSGTTFFLAFPAASDSSDSSHSTEAAENRVVPDPPAGEPIAV